MGNKINKDVTYPSKLNIGPYMSSSSKEKPQWYELYAVLVHSGFSCQSGHYYAYAKAANGQWYCFNDSSVYQVSANQALNQQAYLLFYHKAFGHKKFDANFAIKPSCSLGIREPILHVLNKEISKKPTHSHNNKDLKNVFHQNGIKKKHHTSNDIGKRINRENESKFESDDQNIFAKISSIDPTTHSASLNGSSDRGSSSVSQSAILSKSTLTSSQSKPLQKITSTSNPLLKSDNNKPHHPAGLSKINSETSKPTQNGNGSAIVNGKHGKPSEMAKQSKSSTFSTHNGTSSSPPGKPMDDWMEKKWRERRSSSESSNSKISPKHSKKSPISFKIRSFSNLPHHQKQWQKVHGSRPKSKRSVDEDSTSSNESRRSDKEKLVYERKLKMLGKHKASGDDGEVEVKKLKKSNSTSDKNPIRPSNPIPNEGSTVRDYKHSSETKERSGILNKLLEQSSSKAYGGQVSSWSGNPSVVEADAKTDYFRQKRESRLDSWDQEFDRGKSKKIKVKTKREQDDSNLFQKFQNYKLTNSY